MKSIQEYWDLVYRPVNKERMLQIQEYYCRIGIKVIAFEFKSGLETEVQM